MPRFGYLAFLLASAACGGGSASGQTGAPPPMPVKIATLTPTTIRDTTEYIGRLKSRRSITVQPQVDGKLVKIFVKAGDTVEAGTPLIQIDPARQQASVSSAQATRNSRLASLSYAKQQYERVQRLYAENAVSKQELDQAKANVDAAQADANALGAQIRENEVQLEYYRILAPAGGVVGDIPVRVGDYVTPQTVLTTLTDNNALESYISVPVERANELTRDLEVVLLDATGASIGTGHVHFISPQVNPDTQSVLIKTDIRNDGGVTLRAEQFVRARVVWSTHEGVTVPALSVLRMNGQTFVYVAEAKDGGLVAKLRPVSLGELTDAYYVVQSGLKAGEKVVVGGVEKLRDGAPIVEQAPPPPAAK